MIKKLITNLVVPKTLSLCVKKSFIIVYKMICSWSSTRNKGFSQLQQKAPLKREGKLSTDAKIIFSFYLEQTMVRHSKLSNTNL